MTGAEINTKDKTQIFLSWMSGSGDRWASSYKEDEKLGQDEHKARKVGAGSTACQRARPESRGDTWRDGVRLSPAGSRVAGWWVQGLSGSEVLRGIELDAKGTVSCPKWDCNRDPTHHPDAYAYVLEPGDDNPSAVKLCHSIRKHKSIMTDLWCSSNPGRKSRSP